jgi:hypothetical protein
MRAFTPSASERLNEREKLMAAPTLTRNPSTGWGSVSDHSPRAARSKCSAEMRRRRATAPCSLLVAGSHSKGRSPGLLIPTSMRKVSASSVLIPPEMRGSKGAVVL